MKISREAAETELRKRALNELRDRDPDKYRAEIRRLIVKSFTIKQRIVYEALRAGLRYIALCCGRRSGKTNLLVKLIILTMLDSGHNEAVFYVAWSLKLGKGLIWADLEKMCRDYCLDTYWRLNENEGIIKTPEGSAFFIFGLNKEKQSDQARGFRGRLFCTDESQDVEHLLERMLTAVSPVLLDFGGAFIASGTPGYVPQGTWFDWCHGGKGFKCFTWTIRENEKFPRDVESALREEMALKGFDTFFAEHGEHHPEFKREWLGIWAEDASSLICEFLSGRNTIQELPPEYNLGWHHVIGMDYGWDDAITWVVVAANPYGPERIVVHAEAHENLDNDAAAEVTSRLVRDFATTYVVCDPAGGGKGFYAVFNSKYGKTLGCQIRPADKLGKVESVKAINTDLRVTHEWSDGVKRGRLVVCLPEAEPLAKEIRVLRWKNKERAEVQTTRTIRDDCFDGFRYAMVEIAPWQVQQPKSDESRAAAQKEAAWREQVKTDPDAREREERNRRARSSSKNGSSWWGSR